MVQCTCIPKSAILTANVLSELTYYDLKNNRPTEL